MIYKKSNTVLSEIAWTHLTDLSSDPDTAYCASPLKAAERTLSVCPSNVFITPVLFRSHVLSVLSHDEDRMHISHLPVSLSLEKTVAMYEITSRCPSIVTRSGPPGKQKEGWRGVSNGGWSSKAVMTNCLRKGLKEFIWKRLLEKAPLTKCVVLAWAWAGIS